MIGIIDYGAGNLKSVEKAFSYLGYDVKISDDLEFLSSCDKIVLPGVGAFADCMNMIVQKKLDKVVYDAVDKNKPFLGICLGLQLLFESSEEGGFCKGLGVIKGHVRKFTDTSLKIPQIGWNMIKKAKPNLTKTVRSAAKPPASSRQRSLSTIAKPSGILELSTSKGSYDGTRFFADFQSRHGPSGLGTV